MRLPASTQAVPDTCGAAGAISSPAEPLCTQKSQGKTSVTTPGSEHALCLHFCLTPGIRLGALTSRVPGRDAKVPSPPARPEAIARKQVIARPSPHRPATGSWPLPGRRPHSPLELEADPVAVLQDGHEGLGVVVSRPPEGQALGQPLHGQQPRLPEQPLVGQRHHAGPAQGLTCRHGGWRRGLMRGQPGWGGGRVRPRAGAVLSHFLWCQAPRRWTPLAL